MAAPIDDINFDLQDNRAFILAEDDGRNDLITNVNSETSESSFQTCQRDKKTTTVISSTQDELKTIITICIFFGVSVAIALILTIYLGPPQVIPHGVVSSKSMPCSEIGGQILKSGGSAVDSFVAVVLCEAVYDPSVIFGCGVLTFHDQRKNSSSSLDFSCTDAENKLTESNSVVHPTLLKGLAVIHENFGSLKWKDVLQPVINSFTLTDPIERNQSTLKMIDLLIGVSQKGVDYFYNDFLPKVNWTGMNAKQLDELRSYRPNPVLPQRIVFDEYFIESVQSSCSSSMLMLISVLENLKSSEKVDWNSTDFYHYFVETSKLVEANVENITMLTTSNEEWKGFAKYLASQILDDKALQVDVHPLMNASLHALMISVIGPNDDLISTAVWHGNTSDIEDMSSSKEETAITMIVHNIYKPCALRLAVTSKNYITLAQVLINHFGRNMNLTDAMSAPKLNVIGNNIFYEKDFSDVVIGMLKEKGHSHFVQSNILDEISIIWKDKEDIGSLAKNMSRNVYSF